MKLTFTDLQLYIIRAKSAGACFDDIEELSSFTNVDQFIQHKRAPEWSLWYAKRVVNGPFPEGEFFILQDKFFTYDYVRRILETRWDLAEKVIITDPQLAFLYAKNVIGDRWLEAEPVILTNAYYAAKYAIFVKKNSVD